jgi:hypothetical protein
LGLTSRLDKLTILHGVQAKNHQEPARAGCGRGPDLGG